MHFAPRPLLDIIEIFFYAAIELALQITFAIVYKMAILYLGLAVH